MKVIATFDLPDDINLDFCRTRVRVEQFIFPVKEVEENPAKAKYSSPILIAWCPLKPMPMKRETMVHWKSIGGGDIPMHEISDYDKGWNDCVEFLEGDGQNE